MNNLILWWLDHPLIVIATVAVLSVAILALTWIAARPLDDVEDPEG